ncbi:growth hormone secretagogue receptor type 1-like [Syngnathus typhle]|uniref:growth hormone secretagogue receptor type 1-like n=1 Tax=Syngnathus typhle TaxID=161592 RepID=UPI002A6A5DD8|nr:growth hormone secretagogue receptor type 1-like [Syngnathus typhle]
MDLMMLEDMGSGCEDDNCGLASGFLEDCPNQNCDWNQPVFGFTALVCVTIIYIPVLLLGLLGNVLTILVVWLRPHMRSSTYLYLSSMAVSDLMILLLLPLDLYKLWRPRPWLFGDLACKMTMFLSECCTFCTILHITFLSLERYVAVCWPIIAKTLVTRRRTKALIGCLWLGAAVSAAPVLVMVGVEEVGQEDLRVNGWRENGRWMGEDGQAVGFAMDGDEETHHSFEGELDDLKWGEEARQLKLFKEEESGMEVRDEQNKTREIINKKQEDVKEVYGDQQKKRKADEGGGGWEANAAHRTWIDRRECRCTQYAISSGLLSAMMILSNLYFLVPVCILGLVYGLIGRTLWLRPQSSRRDQSHRHTVKMLGVIVMAFVLCWLPFHVDRTIFVFSLGTGMDQPTVNTDESINNLQNGKFGKHNGLRLRTIDWIGFVNQALPDMS